mmetsp:Transcript_39140/g.79015  ORF Transcript_39140/g.79015 Transcript_39140/m.79015 type:complete len:183 (-) Transcript_39140:172-720(-)
MAPARARAAAPRLAVLAVVGVAIRWLGLSSGGLGVTSAAFAAQSVARWHSTRADELNRHTMRAAKSRTKVTRKRKDKKGKKGKEDGNKPTPSEWIDEKNKEALESGAFMDTFAGQLVQIVTLGGIVLLILWEIYLNVGIERKNKLYNPFAGGQTTAAQTQTAPSGAAPQAAPAAPAPAAPAS